MNAVSRLISNKTLMGTLIIVFFWYVLHLAIQSNIVPGPLETFIAFFGLLHGVLLPHMGISLFRVVSAILLSTVIGVPLGLVMGFSKKTDAIVSPIAYILYPIPKVAFLPLFLVLFGLGNWSKIILIFSIIVFQILLAVRDGVKEIPEELYLSVKSLGLNKGLIYWNLVIPAVMPKTISAIRVSIGVSIATLFFSENYATSYGIGYFIMSSWVMADYVQMFAGILALSIMGILLFQAIDWMEKKLCPWM